MHNNQESAAQGQMAAVVDIGSNSVRMVAAEVQPDSAFHILERMERPVPLGHNTFVSGRIQPETMNAAIAILRDYRTVLDSYHVKHVRAVATSAVREASNRDAFVDRIAMATDLNVEVIEPAEEGRLTVSAVRAALGNAFGINKGRTLIVEVGGGSALLTFLNDGEIASSEGYNLGAIRLQEMLGIANEPPHRAADLLSHHISNVIMAIGRTLPLASVESFVAIGGDARFAARQVGRGAGVPDASIIDRKDFDRFVTVAALDSTEELTRKHGIPFATAETLVPALLAYQSLIHATKAKELLVSNVSMRDGLLLDLARYVTGKEDMELATHTIHSAETTGEKYLYDAKHAHQVAQLAVRLYDELKAVHRMPPRYRLLLRVAAILHEIGGFVSSRAHHKHSYYLISHSPIYGLRQRESEIVANTARYHRRSAPKTSHLDYMNLSRGDRIIVNKMASLLRVADALDRGHASQIRDFHLDIRSSEAVISVPNTTDLSLERRALAQKQDMFEETFGLRLRIEEDTRASTTPRRATAIE